MVSAVVIGLGYLLPLAALGLIVWLITAGCAGVAQPAERPVALGGDRRDRGVLASAVLRRPDPGVRLHPRAAEVLVVPEQPFGLEPGHQPYRMIASSSTV